MKHLLPLMRKIEVHLRANRPLPPEVLDEIASLATWDYEIVVDFMNRVDYYMKTGRRELTIKVFERFTDDKYLRWPEKGPVGKLVDLVIATVRRDILDPVLTDVHNRLPVPGELKHDFVEIWGLPVTRARNLAVEQACRMGARYLLFVDDDIVAPQGSLYKLWETMQKTGAPAVAGNYFRKTEPLRSAHVTSRGEITPEWLEKGGVVEADKVVAMGYTLIDLGRIREKVPFPLFWEFVAPDGLWAMGEDAFFTRNVIEYLGQAPVVDLDVWCLHYDKQWHRMYGIRKPGEVYATNNTFLDVDHFERMRVPPRYPLVMVCVPKRRQEDPVACQVTDMKTLRGYRTDLLQVFGLPVDQAREALVQEAIKRGAEYILFLDDDVVPPDDGLTMLQEAIELPGVDIAAGDYPLKGHPVNSVHTVLDRSKGGIVTELDRADLSALERHPQNPDLVRSNWLIGLGFCLIKTEVFKQLRPPYFRCHAKHPKQPEDGINEDAHFCELALEAGFGVWIHTKCKCLHVDFKTGKVWALPGTDLNRTKWAAAPFVGQMQIIQ